MSTNSEQESYINMTALRDTPTELDEIEFLTELESIHIEYFLSQGDKENALRCLNNYDTYLEEFLKLEEKKFYEKIKTK